MAFKTLLVCAIVMAAAQPVVAACPSPAPGSLAEETKAHGERIVCFQRELSEDTARRKLQIDLDQMNRRLQDLQLQGQLDVLTSPQPVFTVPAFP